MKPSFIITRCRRGRSSLSPPKNENCPPSANTRRHGAIIGSPAPSWRKPSAGDLAQQTRRPYPTHHSNLHQNPSPNTSTTTSEHYEPQKYLFTKTICCRRSHRRRWLRSPFSRHLEGRTARPGRCPNQSRHVLRRRAGHRPTLPPCHNPKRQHPALENCWRRKSLSSHRPGSPQSRIRARSRGKLLGL